MNNPPLAVVVLIAFIVSFIVGYGLMKSVDDVKK